MKILRAELEATAADPRGFPAEVLPEVAFLGRSNVGKSSLLNRLVHRRRLAYTSRTPGKTRLVHFFRVERPKRTLRFVDLPGYGYARVSHEERGRWRRLVEGYLATRAALRLAVLLLDLRRDPEADEEELLAWLAERDLPVLMVLTKADKLKPMRRAERLRRLAEQLPLPPEQVVVTAAQSGLGIEALWRAIDARLWDAETGPGQAG